MATERRAVPYVRIAKMVGDGMTTEQIARAIGRYDEGNRIPRNEYVPCFG